MEIDGPILALFACLLFFKPYEVLTATVIVLGMKLFFIYSGQLSRQRTVGPPSEYVRVARKPIELKLSIDKRRNRVVFAECNKDFVNVLLSFLTLPMGTIIRLADKKSGIGCMDDLYKSVEYFDEEYFWTKAGKTMLLHPRSAYGLQCNSLLGKIDEIDYSVLYTCRSTPCLDSRHGLFSMVKNSICACGQSMDNEIFKVNGVKNIRGGFINNEIDRYIVRDDLKVLPASIDNTLSWFRKRKIKDSTDVKIKIVNVGRNEVLQLLLRWLISKTPLTDVFLVNNRNIDSNSLSMPYKYLREQNSISRKMRLKLWFSKSTKNVLCIEAEEAAFVDYIFSFLTFPIGAIINLLNGNSSMGSADKLYRSAAKLIEMQIISMESKETLLSPKLESMFGFGNQLLPVEEKIVPAPLTFDNKNCFCYLQNKPCFHFMPKLQIMNPKYPNMTTTGGGFVKGCRLLVTDKLEIKPLSIVSNMQKLDGIPFDDMEYMYVSVGEEEALNLLQASLISKNVLSHAFSAKVINRG